MNNYIISACSTADLTKEQFEALDVKYIYFHYSMDGKQYLDDMGQTVSFKEFYDKMRAGADTRTSQINPEEFIDPEVDGRWYPEKDYHHMYTAEVVAAYRIEK